MVTLEDISLEVGCSVNTVSKALNNKPDVSEATRKRVIEAAKRLGYVPNFLAKSLVTKTTGTIGVVVPSVLHPAYTELIESIAHAASRERYSTFLALSGYEEEKESQAVENFYQKRVDGLLVIPISPMPPYHEMLERFNVPVVYLMDDIQDASSFFIGLDRRESAFLATSRLLEKGSVAPALLHSATANRNSLKRMVKGFEAALGRHRLPFSETQVRVLATDSDASLFDARDGIVLEDGSLLPVLRRWAHVTGNMPVASCLGTLRDEPNSPLMASQFDFSDMASRAFSFLMSLVREEQPPAARKIFLSPL